MGTSLSGLTPATTFDGLLKVGDNDPLTATLKPISTGDGTDTMLELSTSALQIGGATGMYWDNTNKRLGLGTDNPSATFEVYGEARLRNNVNVNGRLFNSATGILNLNNLVYIQSNVGIGESTPTSRLHVKGSGATSATTSLLVQNSAGTNIFKVVDDNTMFYHTHKFRSAGGYLYIEGEGNADRSLKVGQNITASSYDGHIFKTYDGTAYSEAMRITGANDQFVGIGETTPTARLHVKGSGNDNTTTSLLVQNSDATDLLKVSDDGVSNVWLPSSGLKMQRSSACRLEVRGVGAATNIDISPWSGSMSIGGANVNKVSVGSTTPLDSKFSIKGSGATSATTALLVQNSAGTELFKVQDDGRVNVALGLKISNLNVIDWDAGTSAVRYFYQSGVGNHVFYTNSGTERMKLNNDGNLGIAETTPTARLHIKGSGNDATTTALLVQNSDGTELMSLDDVGGVRLGGDGSATTKANIKLDAFSGLFNVTAAKFGNWNGAVYAVFSGLAKTDALFAFGNDVTTASTRMHIKGLGATSATTALLVENSAGTDLLKVKDDGSVLLANNAFQIQASQMVSYRPGIFGGAARNASAVLQADSTTQGFLPPRMTDAERDAIATPAAGLMIYDTSNNQMNYWNGSSWIAF